MEPKSCIRFELDEAFQFRKCKRPETLSFRIVCGVAVSMNG